MESLEYNIEFSHIYSSEGFTEEHERSIEVLHDTKNEIEGCKKVFTVLVDDRTLAPVISLPDIVDKIKEDGASVDWLALESKFEQCAVKIKECYFSSSIIRKDNKKKNCIEEYCEIRKEKILLARVCHGVVKPTCALLSATWALCRLGLIEPPHGALIKIGNRPFVAKRNITILHKKYLEVESKALSLIRLTPFKEVTSRIEYKFYS